MLTLTASQHLASVRERLGSLALSEQQYNDLAVIALHYSMHAKKQADRLDAASLYDAVVREAAEVRKIVQRWTTNEQ